MTGDRPCPDHQTLASFLLGHLPPEREEAVNLHLEACAECEARAQQIEKEPDPLIAALRQPPTPPVLPAGTPTVVLAGPAPASAAAPFDVEGFRVLDEIGRGGMGVVYRAYQHRLNRVVAIKMILTGQLAGAEERVRFLMEGALLARLSHPHFVQVYEVGTLEPAPGTVQPYLVLEYVEGGSLKARLAEKPLPFREAAQLSLVLARAMAAAHAQGIIHRDLKPANVLIARDGTLKITDFGLAKDLDTRASLTPSGHAVGTPSYMAPEQARAHAHVGPAVDIYALGAILYEMLTGRPPFTGEAVLEVILQVLENTPAPASRLRAGVPRDLETICLKCLQKEPHSRYARAADLADDLECWLENRPIRARPAGRVERTVKWARRHPLPAALLAFLILSLVLGSTASTYFGVTAVKHANETQIALEKEEAARQRAERATQAERWERYLAEIAAASNALQANNTGPARRSLEAAPEEYRNWEWRHLHSQLDGAHTVVSGQRPSAGMDLSPDGRRLAIVTLENAVRLWDVAAGKETAVLRAPGEALERVRFSPDGSRLATGRHHFRVWDAATGALLWQSPHTRGESGRIEFAWGPGGRQLAGVQDGLAVVWDAATGKEISLWQDPSIQRPLTFSPDGKHVAFAGTDFTVRVCESATGRTMRTLRGPTGSVESLAYSPDGRRLAAGTNFPENGVHLWDAATGTALPVGRGQPAHTNLVNVLAFSPHGRLFATGSMDQTIPLWDAETGAARALLEGHTGFVNDLAFSADGKHLVSASADQTLRLWDPAAGRLRAVLRGHTDNVVFARFDAAGTLLASASTDGTVRLWDVEVAGRSGVLRGHENFVYDVAFRPDGGEVASASWDGTVRRWDPTSGRPTAEPLRPPGTGTDTPILTSLAYSPDGRHLAALARAEGVWLWDLAAGKRFLLAKGPTSTTFGECRVAFHPGGKLLAEGTMNGPVRLWDPGTRAEAGVLAGHRGMCRAVSFRPDGAQLASAAADDTVRLWDVASRQETAVLTGGKGAHNLAYSADGRLLAAGSWGRTVTVWRVETHEPVGQLTLGSPVYGVAWSADDTRLACACADNTIRLLDIPTLREVTDLRGHTAYVHAVQFSPDGTRLASASGDWTVRIWDTLSAQDRARARGR